MDTHDQDSEYELEFTPEQTRAYQQFLQVTSGRCWYYELWSKAQQSPALARQEALRITEEDNVPCDADWSS